MSESETTPEDGVVSFRLLGATGVLGATVSAISEAPDLSIPLSEELKDSLRMRYFTA